jgi:hypothetical protein
MGTSILGTAFRPFGSRTRELWAEASGSQSLATSAAAGPEAPKRTIGKLSSGRRERAIEPVRDVTEHGRETEANQGLVETPEGC